MVPSVLNSIRSMAVSRLVPLPIGTAKRWPVGDHHDSRGGHGGEHEEGT